MKNSVIIFVSLLVSGHVAAQNIKLDVQSSSVEKGQDSTVISFKMKVDASGLDTKNQIRLIPILTNTPHSKELPIVILNGKKVQALYQRSQAMAKRKGTKELNPAYAVLGIESGHENHSVDYRVSVAPEDWMSQAKLVIKKEYMNDKGGKMLSETIPVSTKSMHVLPPEASSQLTETVSVPMDVPKAVESVRAVVAKTFKGSYLSPDSDATDERNQKELNFSLEEARIIADVNPQMLSLRELYTVALSHKNNPSQYYRIIDISVKIYPASPVANLNAAAAAIERADVQAAGRYLQIASHETVAYKNCRGAYELLCNNVYEGIRLLKAAQAEGSEEAAQNLKLFFEMNQRQQ